MDHLGLPGCLPRSSATARLKPDMYCFRTCSHKLPLSDTKESSSREDAKLLLQHLEEALPAGAISSKYRRAVGNSGDALQLYSDVLKLKQDFKVVDSILRESGRHLAAECLERAHVTEQVRLLLHGCTCPGTLRYLAVYSNRIYALHTLTNCTLIYPNFHILMCSTTEGLDIFIAELDSREFTLLVAACAIYSF